MKNPTPQQRQGPDLGYSLLCCMHQYQVEIKEEQRPSDDIVVDKLVEQIREIII